MLLERNFLVSKINSNVTDNKSNKIIDERHDNYCTVGRRKRESQYFSRVHASFYIRLETELCYNRRQNLLPDETGATFLNTRMRNRDKSIGLCMKLIYDVVCHAR